MIELKKGSAVPFLFSDPEPQPLCQAPPSPQGFAVSSREPWQMPSMVTSQRKRAAQTVATPQWLFQLKLNTVKDLVPQSHPAYFYCPVATCVLETAEVITGDGFISLILTHK